MEAERDEWFLALAGRRLVLLVHPDEVDLVENRPRSSGSIASALSFTASHQASSPPSPPCELVVQVREIAGHLRAELFEGALMQGEQAGIGDDVEAEPGEAVRRVVEQVTGGDQLPGRCW